MTNEPPVLLPPRPSAAGRVAIGLLLFGILELISTLGQLAAAIGSSGPVSINFNLGFVALWVAAWLVWRGNRSVWTVMLYLPPVTVGLIIGGVVGVAVGLPAKLLRSLALNEPDWSAFILLYVVAYAGLFLWLTWEAGRVVPSSRARRAWARPPALAAYGALPAFLFCCLLFVILQGSWTRRAVELARHQEGNTYDYWVQSWREHTTNGETRGAAVVLAYNEQELKRVVVRW